MLLFEIKQRSEQIEKTFQSIINGQYLVQKNYEPSPQKNLLFRNSLLISFQSV